MDFLDKYEEGQVQELIDSSHNLREVLIKMGVSPNGGANTVRLSQYIKDHNIKTYFYGKKDVSDEEVFCENSIVSPQTVKRRLRNNNMIKYECAICGLPPFWNGKELQLTLDHKDGVNSNNQIDNLRWVCPNCDRQLPTFCSKKRKVKDFHCSNCGKKLEAASKTGLCWECWKALSPESKKQNSRQKDFTKITYLQKDITRKENSQVKCPVCGGQKELHSKLCMQCRIKQNREDLIALKEEKYGINRDIIKQLIRHSNFTQIGKKYGVTDNTIRKWCKSYNLPFRIADIRSLTDEEWEKI